MIDINWGVEHIKIYVKELKKELEWEYEMELRIREMKQSSLDISQLSKFIISLPAW